VEAFVLIGHDQGPSDVSCQDKLACGNVVVEAHQPGADFGAEKHDSFKSWPVFVFLWYL
jgi:hypothetical protein